MKKVIKIQVLEVGDRVRGKLDADQAGDSYFGIVIYVNHNGDSATIMRSDNKTGCGYRSGWKVTRKTDGRFGSDLDAGFLSVVRQK